MKAKTLKLINEQVANILCDITKTPLSATEQVERMERVRAIANRYRRNAFYWLKNQMGPADLDEYGAITSVPADVYAK